MAGAIRIREPCVRRAASADRAAIFFHVRRIVRPRPKTAAPPLNRGQTAGSWFPTRDDLFLTAKGCSMRTRSILVLGLSFAVASGLSGCLGTAGGAAVTAVAGTAATGAITSGSNRARFSRLECSELEAEIAGAQRAMINPLAIPSSQAYIRDARAVAEEKGCELD